jgi:predicted nucleic acid-binding protein
VLDASVAVKWHLSDEDDASRALALLGDYISRELRLIGPDHIRYEVASAIRVATLQRPPRLTVEQGERAIREFLSFAVPTVRDDALTLDAYAVANANQTAFYDGLYLALAERLDLSFITADGKLYQCIRQLPRVILLGDWAPGSRR